VTSVGARVKSALRCIARATLPRRVRRFLRIAAREIPHRLRDFPADVRDVFAGKPLPPARLRRRVSRTSSRREFEEIGRGVASELIAAFDRCREPGASYSRWLDFGSGAGRVARHLAGFEEVAELEGADVDRDLVAWTDRRLAPARFRLIPPLPPTELSEGRFDVAICVSVFTHFSEEAGRRWAEEMARLLRPGGLFILSTHGAAIAAAQPLTEAQRRRFADLGFLFIPGRGTFNEDAAFHSAAYLRSAWSPWFDPVEFVEHGLMGFQDLCTWRRR